jgi:hypothetical protein
MGRVFQVSKDIDKTIILQRFIIARIVRLLQTLTVVYIVCFIVIFFGLSLDEKLPDFMSQNTKIALEEAKGRGFIDFAFEVLKTSKIALITSSGIYFYNLWRIVKKLTSTKN